jgi:hypothetical protein
MHAENRESGPAAHSPSSEPRPAGNLRPMGGKGPQPWLAELLALLLPLAGERLQELREPCGRSPVQNALDDVWGEQGEPQDAANARSADPLRTPQL